MKNNKILIAIFIFFLLILISCSKSDNEVLNPKDNDIIKVELDDSAFYETEEIKEIEDIDPNKIISPLNGLKYHKDDLKKRPVVVSIDNHPSARWQAGISQAEIVYECEVENPYTRYLCVFLAHEPELVGPVRSARPYLIYYALENDGIFVHVGGSQDAFNEAYNNSVADIDGLYSGAMWRYYDTDKYAPHNMYTTLKSIRDESERLGYKTSGEFEPYMFNEHDEELSCLNKYNAQEINITYNKQNTTDYSYNKDEKLYYRFKDDEKHIDELNDEQLTTKNIIVINTSKRVLDNEGRLFLGTVGSGDGIYITNGEAVNIRWEKLSKKERTMFYIEDEKLCLNPGNTWIQVVSYMGGVIIE